MKLQPNQRLELSGDRSRSPLTSAMKSVTSSSPTTSSRPTLLHLFSGPSGRSDGLASCLAEIGWDCEEWDILNGPDFDLTDNENWCRLSSRISVGCYDACLLGPPCNTFSNARNDHDGGPQPLRTASGAERYGRQGLEPKDKEKVKIGTLLAVRSARVFSDFHNQRKPAVLEQPLWIQDGTSVSMLNFDEYARLRSLPGVSVRDMVQCVYGARVVKSTTLLSYLVDLSDVKSECNHPVQRWTRPSDGKIHWGAHPPLQGIEWFLSDAEFAEHTALHGRGHPATDPGGGYISRSTAAYPADLNRYLAQKFALAGRPQVPQISSMIVCGRWGNTLVRREDYKGDDHHSASSRYSFSAPLRGLKDDGSEGRFVGGMRHPRKALGMQPGLEHAGRHIRDALLKILGGEL